MHKRLIKTNSRLTIGLLGGSFDPPHIGHLQISLKAMKGLGLDQVWWLITPQNPLKSMPATLSTKERKKMADSLTQNNRIIVTDIEKKFQNYYTANTIQQIKQMFPNYKFVLLMGIDNLIQLHRWKKWQYIAKSIPILAFDRDAEIYKASHSKASIFTNKITNARMSTYRGCGHHLLRMRKVPDSSSSIREIWRK